VNSARLSQESRNPHSLSALSPVSPQLRTSADVAGMSQLGQKRKSIRASLGLDARLLESGPARGSSTPVDSPVGRR
jgi:hypothetical protein